MKLVMDMKAEAMESVGQGGEATNVEVVLLKIEHFDRGWCNCCEEFSLGEWKKDAFRKR